MYLLDTNIISELRRPERAGEGLRAFAAGTPRTQIHLSVVTLMEIEIGVLRAERRDPSQAAVIRAWLTDQILPRFKGRIFPVDAPVALRCVALHVPDPRSDRDAFIAATALVHGLTVVTRNVADFAPTGVALINP